MHVLSSKMIAIYFIKNPINIFDADVLLTITFYVLLVRSLTETCSRLEAYMSL